MLGQQFYHETMRNVIVAFGTLFNNIHLVRKNNSGAITQTMKVPLAYGPRQKWLTRLDADASLDSKVAITLPRLGFEIQNLSYYQKKVVVSSILSMIVRLQMQTDHKRVI